MDKAKYLLFYKITVGNKISLKLLLLELSGKKFVIGGISKISWVYFGWVFNLDFFKKEASKSIGTLSKEID